MRLSILSTMAEAPWGGSEELWAGVAFAARERGWGVQALLPHFADAHPKRTALAQAGVTLSQWKHDDVRKWSAGNDRTVANPYQSLYEPRPNLLLISHGGMLDMVNGHVGLLSDLWRSGVPYVLVIQANTESYWPNDAQRAFMRRYFEGALHVVFVSRENLEIARRQLAHPLTNAVVWQQPVNLTTVKPQKWPNEPVLTMASVARIDVGSKGQDMLIEILSRPLWRAREWKLNLYGTGISAALVQESAVQGGIRDRVQFNGQVPDIAQLWRSNHVLVMPSRLEGTPLALLEALCCGRPAMVTAVGGSADWIVEGETGFVASAARTELVADAMERLWENRAALSNMGDAAARFMAASFNPKPGAGLLSFLERGLERRIHNGATAVPRPLLSIVRLGAKAGAAACEPIPGVEWIDVVVGEAGDVSRTPDRSIVREPLKNPAVAANSGLAVAAGGWALVVDATVSLSAEYIRGVIAILEAGVNVPALCAEAGTPPKFGVFPLQSWLGCGGFPTHARDEFQGWFWGRLAGQGVVPKLASTVAIPRHKARTEPASPKVSVVVTCYNYADYLGRCLDSVLAQTYRDFEVIIVNDGSTDNSGQVADAIAALHPGRVRVLHQPNAGQPAISRNNGIRIARGELILPLDADDWIAPAMLQECVAALDASNIGVAYTDTIYCHDRGQIRMYFGGEFSAKVLREQNQLNCCSMYRKKVWETVGGYRTNVRGYEDWDFWLAAAAAGFSGKRITQPLFFYRAKETGVFAQTNGKDKILRANIRLNNPTCYSEAERAEAKAFLANQAQEPRPTPPPAAVKAPSVSADELRQRVVGCYTAGDLEGCVTACVAALAVAKDDADILLVYADTLTKLNRLSEAIAVLDRLIAVQPAVDDHRQLRASIAAALEQQQTPVAASVSSTPSDAFRGKRILVYSDDPGMGGAAHYNHTILLALKRAGAEVFSAQPERDTPLVREQAKAGITHCWLAYDPVTAFTRSFTDDSDASRIVAAHQPHLIFFSDCCAMSNVAAKSVAVKHGIPYVLICHSEAGYLATRFPHVLGITEELLKYAADVIAVSKSSRAVLQQYFKLPANKGTVIYNGRPAQYFTPRRKEVRARIRAELKLPESAVMCLTVARHDADKGFTFQIEAIRRLVADKKIGSLHFVWAGEGPAQEGIAELVRNNRIQDRVTMLGYRWDVPDLIEAADIFVLPSSSEAFPLCTIEAMAKAVPVIASAVGGIPEQLGEAGKLVPNPTVNAEGAIAQLVAALVAWQTKPADRVAFGVAAHERATAMFREEIMVENTLRVLASALPGNGRSVEPPPTKPAAVDTDIAPTVSVIVPCYKQAEYLTEAVESIIAQTYTDWETIIVNDGSPDNTNVVAQRLIAAHPKRRIRLIHKSNGGLADARNAGIAAARGKYILPLDADDKIHPEFLAKTAALLDSSPKIAIAYVDWQYFGAQSDVRQALDYDFAVLCAKENLFTCTSLFRKEAWTAVGGYNRNMTCGLEDWDFWISCGEKGFIGQRIPEPLFFYRVKRGSMIQTLRPHAKTMFARIVLNHPALYNAETTEAARKLVSAANLPGPKPSSRGIEWTSAVQRANDEILNAAESALREQRFDEIIPQLQRVLAQAPTVEQIKRIEDMAASLPKPNADATSDQQEYRPAGPLFGPAHCAQIEQMVKAFAQNPADSNLRSVRQQMIEHVLAADTGSLAKSFSAEFGKAFRAVMSSGLSQEPASPELTQASELWRQDIVASAEKNGAVDARKVCAYMLAAPAYRAPVTFHFEVIPAWLLEDYFEYVLQSPQIFGYAGEAEQYAGHLAALAAAVAQLVRHKPNGPLTLKVASTVGTRLNCIPAYVSAGNTTPFMADRAAILEFVLTKNGARLDAPLKSQYQKGRKIRVGFLNAHFGEQTETHVTLPTLQLDRNRFEVWLFPLATTGTPLETYCRSFADKFVPLPREVGQQVKTIRDAALDIVVIGTNVTAVTNGVTLLATHRLAPIQLASYCSPMSTGMRNVDGFIYGSLSDFEGIAEHFSEKLVVCDGPPGCLDYAHEKPGTMRFDRRSLGLKDDEVVFVNAASCFKIPPELLDAWVRILKSVERSRLVLLPFNPNWASAFPAARFTRTLQETLQRHGLGLDRIVMVKSLPTRADVKALEQICDVYLDTFPFSGSLSVIDPLELGLPTVVGEGTTPRSRAAAALLRDIEMPQLIASDTESYIRRAVQLGSDPAYRSEVRAEILRRMASTPRFLDAARYGRQLSDVLEQLVVNRGGATTGRQAVAQCA